MWNARTVMARIFFREMGTPTITLALLTVRYHASIVNACFFCPRASRVFNVAPHKHLTLPSQLAAKRLFSDESAETTNGLANPTVLLIDFASKLDY